MPNKIDYFLSNSRSRNWLYFCLVTTTPAKHSNYKRHMTTASRTFAHARCVLMIIFLAQNILRQILFWHLVSDNFSRHSFLHWGPKYAHLFFPHLAPFKSLKYFFIVWNIRQLCNAWCKVLYSHISWCIIQLYYHCILMIIQSWNILINIV